MREMPVKRESEKNFRGNPLKDQLRYVCEPEFPVVVRVSHQAATTGVQVPYGF